MLMCLHALEEDHSVASHGGLEKYHFITVKKVSFGGIIHYIRPSGAIAKVTTNI